MALKRVLGGLALAPLLAGCFWATTKSEGDALRKDVTTLQGQITSKQQQLDSRDLSAAVGARRGDQGAQAQQR